MSNIMLRAAMMMVATLLATACAPEPLSLQQEQRLQRIFAEMPERQRIGIEQNLRFAGLYKGELRTEWAPQLAEGLNQAHFELDFVDGKYSLHTDAGARSFLSAMAQPEVRKHLADELSGELPAWTQTRKPGTKAETTGEECRIDGGGYGRNGETADLIFFRSPDGATVDLTWNGWPGASLTQLFIVKFGNEAWPMVGTAEEHDAVTWVPLWNKNGAHIVDAIKRSQTISIGGSNLTEPIELPVGDLYQTGLALERCFETKGGG